jgi:GAF domain-containing protein
VKRPNARKVSTSGPSVGDLQKQLDALSGELKEAREQQTATAEVLQVINSSPGDLAPVFNVMLQKALSLCAAAFGQLVTFDGVSFRAAAWRGYEPGRGATAPLPGMALHQLVHGERIVHIPDITADDVYRSGNPVRRRLADEYGGRTAIWVALRKDEELLGAFVIFRTEVRPFSDKQIVLLQGFAAQAVIAMENARLLTETREALERQTATADILKVIASSPSDAQPVFEAMVNSAAKLFEPCGATITTLEEGKLHFNATAAIHPGFNVDTARAVYPIPFDPGRSPSARAILERRIIEISDTDAPDTPEFTSKAAAAGGFRSAVFVPLINEGNGIGTIILTHPQVGFRLSEKQLALVRTFADQAVIAIENVRLFDEVQAKTRDLEESLQQQTATADVLKIISRSAFDLQAVFDTLTTSAVDLLDAHSGTICVRDGDVFRYRSVAGGLLDRGAVALPAGSSRDAGTHNRFGASDPVGPDRADSRHSRGSGLCDTHADSHPEAYPKSHAQRAPARKGQDRGRDGAQPPATGTIHATRSGHPPDLRRPGGDRDRECAPVRRIAGANPGTFAIA